MASSTSSLLEQSTAKIGLGIRMVRFNLKRFSKMNDCFVHWPFWSRTVPRLLWAIQALGFLSIVVCQRVSMLVYMALWRQVRIASEAKNAAHNR